MHGFKSCLLQFCFLLLLLRTVCFAACKHAQPPHMLLCAAVVPQTWCIKWDLVHHTAGACTRACSISACCALVAACMSHWSIQTAVTSPAVKHKMLFGVLSSRNSAEQPGWIQVGMKNDGRLGCTGAWVQVLLAAVLLFAFAPQDCVLCCMQACTATSYAAVCSSGASDLVHQMGLGTSHRWCMHQGL